MTKDDKAKLLTLLAEWFTDCADFTDVRFINGNEIARLIKQNIKESHHWINRRKGSNKKATGLLTKDAKITLKKQIQDAESKILKCKCGNNIIKNKTGVYVCSDFFCEH